MNVPIFSDDPIDIELITLLKLRAAQYTPLDAVATRIARRAAWMATTSSDLPEAPDVENAIFATLDRVAIEELGTVPKND